jgi:cell division control protein 11
LFSYIEEVYNAVFEEEQRIHRNPKFEEHRVHALLYFIEPTALGLKKFDIEFMQKLAPRVNIIPVIAKADGLTQEEKKTFKSKVLFGMAHYVLDYGRHCKT